MQKMSDANLDVKSFNTEVALLLKQALVAAGLLEGKLADEVAKSVGVEDQYGETLWFENRRKKKSVLLRTLTPAEQSAVLLSSLNLNPKMFSSDPIISSAIRQCGQIANGNVEAAKTLYSQEKIHTMMEADAGLEAGLRLERAIRKIETVTLKDAAFNARVKYLLDLALVKAGAIPAESLVAPEAEIEENDAEMKKELDRLLAARKERTSAAGYESRELTDAEQVAKQLVAAKLHAKDFSNPVVQTAIRLAPLIADKDDDAAKKLVSQDRLMVADYQSVKRLGYVSHHEERGIQVSRILATFRDVTLDTPGFNEEVSLLLRRALVASGIIQGHEAIAINSAKSLQPDEDDPYMERLWSKNRQPISLLDPAVKASAEKLLRYKLKPGHFEEDPLVAIAIEQCAGIAADDVTSAKILFAHSQMSKRVSALMREKKVSMDKTLEAMALLDLRNPVFVRDTLALLERALFAAGKGPETEAVQALEDRLRRRKSSVVDVPPLVVATPPRVQREKTQVELMAAQLAALNLSARAYHDKPNVAIAIRMAPRIADGDLDAAKNVWAHGQLRRRLSETMIDKDGVKLEQGLVLEQLIRGLGQVDLSTPNFSQQVIQMLEETLATVRP
jgi:hypothetical protein